MCFPSLIRQRGKEAVACCPSGRKDWAHTEASSAKQKARGPPAPFYAPSEVVTFNLLSFPPFAPPWFTERSPYIHPLQWALSPAPQTFRAERQVPQLPVSLVTAQSLAAGPCCEWPCWGTALPKLRLPSGQRAPALRAHPSLRALHGVGCTQPLFWLHCSPHFPFANPASFPSPTDANLENTPQ